MRFKSLLAGTVIAAITADIQPNCEQTQSDEDTVKQPSNSINQVT